METGVWQPLASAGDITDLAQGSSSGFCKRVRGRGGLSVAMVKGSSSSCWFARAVAHPFPFSSSRLPHSLSFSLPTASRSGKRFVRYARGSGPFCSRPFMPSATHRDGRRCNPNTEREYWQVRRDIFNLAALAVRLFVPLQRSLSTHTHRILMLRCGDDVFFFSLPNPA